MLPYHGEKLQSVGKPVLSCSPGKGMGAAEEEGLLTHLEGQTGGREV